MRWSHFHHHFPVAPYSFCVWEFLPFLLSGWERSWVNWLAWCPARGWACSAPNIVDFRRIQIGGEVFTLWSLICLLVKKKKSNKHQPNHASLFLTGSVFNTEPAPAFISPRLPPLRASSVNRTQWSREESHQVPSLKGCLAGPGKNWDCRPSQHLPYMPAHTDSKLASRQRRPGLEPHKGSRRGEGKEAEERKASPLLFLKPVLFWELTFLFFLFFFPFGSPG